jgi:hypothetical protein
VSRPRLLDLQLDEADREALAHLTIYVGTNGYAYYSTWEDGRSNPRTVHGLSARLDRAERHGCNE